MCAIQHSKIKKHPVVMSSINTFTEHRSAVVMSLLTEGEAFLIIFSHLGSYLFPCNKALCSVTRAPGV